MMLYTIPGIKLKAAINNKMKIIGKLVVISNVDDPILLNIVHASQKLLPLYLVSEIFAALWIFRGKSEMRRKSVSSRKMSFVPEEKKNPLFREGTTRPQGCFYYVIKIINILDSSGYLVRCLHASPATYNYAVTDYLASIS
ncbi:hypothetical protein NPIL_501931 [Nephila pilipes]|uniref:Uncharacterized protein n=1 Tax=Nephila pilipes TaxID=299642 RepID=A0A8X6PN63_NEPPI|nr:hypothetical protein NPIL_501931 [Nephila pilipes]